MSEKNNQFQCSVCGKIDHSNFKCNYCGRYFCVEHHLPENHNCSNQPDITPHFYGRCPVCNTPLQSISCPICGYHKPFEERHKPSDTRLPYELKYGYDYPDPKPKKKSFWKRLFRGN